MANTINNIIMLDVFLINKVTVSNSTIYALYINDQHHHIYHVGLKEERVYLVANYIKLKANNNHYLLHNH